MSAAGPSEASRSWPRRASPRRWSPRPLPPARRPRGRHPASVAAAAPQPLACRGPLRVSASSRRPWAQLYHRRLAARRARAPCAATPWWTCAAVCVCRRCDRCGKRHRRRAGLGLIALLVGQLGTALAIDTCIKRSTRVTAWTSSASGSSTAASASTRLPRRAPLGRRALRRRPRSSSSARWRALATRCSPSASRSSAWTWAPRLAPRASRASC